LTGPDRRRIIQGGRTTDRAPDPAPDRPQVLGGSGPGAGRPGGFQQPGIGNDRIDNRTGIGGGRNASVSVTATVSTSPADQVAPREEWLPLGAFAPAREDVEEAQVMIMLAVSKQGVIAGTYDNEATGASRPLQGTVDVASQRAAVAFADGQDTDRVLETGVYNLTQDEAPDLLNLGTDQSMPILLARLAQPDAARSRAHGACTRRSTPRIGRGDRRPVPPEEPQSPGHIARIDLSFSDMIDDNRTPRAPRTSIARLA
jgi:hypothetical protein